MNFERIQEVNYFYQLGSVTIIASILTLIITQIFKQIFKKRWYGQDEIQKDKFLQPLGRRIAFITYSTIYLLTEFYLCHTIIIDGALLVGLLSGASMTLSVSKSIYTWVHQKQKQKTPEIEKNTPITKNESKVWILTKKEKKEQ